MIKLNSKNGLLIFFSIIILSISIIISSKSISNAINNVGLNLVDSSSIISSNENYGNFELIVNDGWIYLYDTNNGQIWKKADNPDSSWELVKHYTE